MDVIINIIAVTAIAGVGGTGVGGLVGALLKKDSKKAVSLLLSFAAGIMLSVVCFDLIPAAIKPENSETEINIFIVIASILIGYGLVFVLNYWIDRCTNHEIKHISGNHPKTADDLDELIHSDHLEEHKKEKSGLFIAGLVMASAIALHNLPEGMVIGASYAKDPTQILGGSGFTMAIVIGLHNIPEGMAVAVPLISGGDKKLHAILLTAVTGAPTIIGALLGYWLGSVSEIMLSLSLGFAGGAMLYVILGELLPEAILMWRSKLPAFAALVGIAVGLMVIFI